MFCCLVWCCFVEWFERSTLCFYGRRWTQVVSTRPRSWQLIRVRTVLTKYASPSPKALSSPRPWMLYSYFVDFATILEVRIIIPMAFHEHCVPIDVSQIGHQMILASRPPLGPPNFICSDFSKYFFGWFRQSVFGWIPKTRQFQKFYFQNIFWGKNFKPKSGFRCRQIVVHRIPPGVWFAEIHGDISVDECGIHGLRSVCITRTQPSIRSAMRWTNRFGPPRNPPVTTITTALRMTTQLPCWFLRRDFLLVFSMPLIVAGVWSASVFDSTCSFYQSFEYPVVIILF